MTDANLREQPLIRLGARGRRALTPRVVAAGGNAQDAAERGDVVRGLLLLHEREPRYGVEFVSLAKKAAAFRRISRSSRKIRTSRRKRRTSACSSVVNPLVRFPLSSSSCFNHV